MLAEEQQEKIVNRDNAGFTKEKELEQTETGAENAEEITRATSTQETPTPPDSESVEEKDEDDEGENEEDDNEDSREHSPRATTCNPMGFVKRKAKRNAKIWSESISGGKKIGEQPELLADATLFSVFGRR